jgi:hypothetical protein
MKVMDESGQLFSVQGTATFLETVTDRQAVFDELRKTPDDVFAVFSDVTKVRGHSKTAFVAKKIRLTDEKSFDDMVKRYSTEKAPPGVVRTLTIIIRGKLLAAS